MVPANQEIWSVCAHWQELSKGGLVRPLSACVHVTAQLCNPFSTCLSSCVLSCVDSIHFVSGPFSYRGETESCVCIHAPFFGLSTPFVKKPFFHLPAFNSIMKTVDPRPKFPSDCCLCRLCLRRAAVLRQRALGAQSHGPSQRVRAQDFGASAHGPGESPVFGVETQFRNNLATCEE